MFNPSLLFPSPSGLLKKKYPKTEIEKGRSFLFCSLQGKAKLSRGAVRPSTQTSAGLTKKGEAVSEGGAGMLSPVISWCTTGMRHVCPLQSSRPLLGAELCAGSVSTSSLSCHLVTALRLAPAMVGWSGMPHRYIGFMGTRSKFASAVTEWSCKQWNKWSCKQWNCRRALKGEMAMQCHYRALHHFKL